MIIDPIGSPMRYVRHLDNRHSDLCARASVLGETEGLPTADLQKHLREMAALLKELAYLKSVMAQARMSLLQPHPKIKYN